MATMARTQTDVTPAIARIGPNALIQTVQALQHYRSLDTALQVLESIGEAHIIAQPPTDMVTETRFITLVQAVVARMGEDASAVILKQAGRQTADYLLVHRIPMMFQRMLVWVPPQWGARLFLMAIEQHAWTFIGSGRFSYRIRPTLQLTVTCSDQHHPLVAAFFAGTFETLFRTLIHEQITFDCSQTHGSDEFLFDYVAQIP